MFSSTRHINKYKYCLKNASTPAHQTFSPLSLERLFSRTFTDRPADLRAFPHCIPMRDGYTHSHSPCPLPSSTLFSCLIPASSLPLTVDLHLAYYAHKCPTNAHDKPKKKEISSFPLWCLLCSKFTTRKKLKHPYMFGPFMCRKPLLYLAPRSRWNALPFLFAPSFLRKSSTHSFPPAHPSTTPPAEWSMALAVTLELQWLLPRLLVIVFLNS